jgi:hypothetical protein
MRHSTDEPRDASGHGAGRDRESAFLWALLVGYWPFLRYVLGFCSVVALFFGPPGSYLLTFGLLLFLSWKVLQTANTSKRR